MKKSLIIVHHFYAVWLMAVFSLMLPIEVWARGDDLPIPILTDTQTVAPAAPVTQANKPWVVQLGAGNAAALAAQAEKLRANGVDARVVLVAGQAKLVVGNWLSASDAASSLKTLRAINAQAFVRQIPAEASALTSAAVMPNSTKAKPVKPLAITATVHPVETQPTPSLVEESLLPVAEKPPLVNQVVDDDDVLPAIVAVAVVSKSELIPETPELQAAVALLEQEVPTVNTPEDNAEKHEQSPAPIIIEQPEKRGIVLPMREKETLGFTASQPLVEPLNLMLSPLYLLPTDTTMQARQPQTLTMQTVLEALVKPDLSATAPVNQTTYSSQSDPVLTRKAKLFSRMANLANAGLWEMALPLVKEAKVKEMPLSALDNLLLGWIWLQNKEPRVAKGYFQAALTQSSQDEARYALGLCYLLLGDKASAQEVSREMKSGNQKDHLRSLLLQ